MKECDKNSEEIIPSYKDFITFEPQVMMFLKKEEAKLIKEHCKIISTLRSKNMSVKEIHRLYWDPERINKEGEKGDHTLSIKTIYRYLEKLENAGLVVVAGQRVTEGCRLTEKLYSRSAKVFFMEEESDKPTWWKSDKGKICSQKLNVIISELFQAPEANSTAFFNLIQTYTELYHQTSKDFFEKAKISDKLENVFLNTDIDEINLLREMAIIFSTFMRQPDLIDHLSTMFKSEIKESKES